MSDSPEAQWQAYHARKRAERLSEAEAVWRALAAAGVGNDTVLVVEFTHFGADRARAEALARQLSEHYTATLKAGNDGYWLVRGTTHPYGVSFDDAQHRDWVEFMCDLAQSHGCVFSTWAVTVHPRGPRIDSEAIEAP